ncbi:MAG: AraC family transcriptional regulator [Bacteroidota bacterium]
MYKNFYREITQLTSDEIFLIYNRYKDDFDFPIHYHHDHELIFIKNGKGVKRIVGDSIEEIEDIELVLVGSNLFHGWEMHNCKNKKIHEICMHIQNDLFDENLLTKNIFEPIKKMFENSKHGILFSNETAYEMMPRLIKLSKRKGFDYFLDFTSILNDLAISENQRLLSQYVPDTDTEEFNKCQRIKIVHDYIHENFNRKITLLEISELINMTPVSFNRFIKKRTFKTFISYINDVRIGYATRLLIETDLSVSEISFKCGFNNIANFNRIFKKTKRITPSKYRLEYKTVIELEIL